MGAMVKIRLIYHPGRGEAVHMRKYVNYLKKVGKGSDGGESPHFTRAAEPVNLDAFYQRMRDDPHAFMVILSPDPSHASDLPLQRCAQAWMLNIERELGGRKIDWLGSVHYDTPDHPHVQFLWRGRDLAGRTLRLHRETISHTLRALADQVEGWYQ